MTVMKSLIASEFPVKSVLSLKHLNGCLIGGAPDNSIIAGSNPTCKLNFQTFVNRILAQANYEFRVDHGVPPV